MKRILVIGASGYVGGRLVPRLLAAGHGVRCLVRDPRKVEGRGWMGAEIVRGDVLDAAALRAALSGCDVVYYLVHAMGAGEKDFESRDRKGAENLAAEAAGAGAERIVYLGGLGRRSENLSPHLRSRNEVGRILAGGSVPVTEFRAAMIIGSGSASFEMMHALVNRLPVMTAPRWVSTLSQPVAIGDVLRYLVDCLDVPGSVGATIDIGGPDILSYRTMMLRLARHLRLRRRIVVVPVLTPRLSSLWVNFVTPIPAALARPLVEGLRSEMVCESDLALRLFPWKPAGFDEAVTRALSRIRAHDVETRWSDAAFPAADAPASPEPSQLLSDVRTVDACLPASAVARAFGCIGGDNGWYYGDLLWEIRGFIDRLFGGVGLRRGRRHPTELVAGDALDFWRVEALVPGEMLLLRAEMKLPGQAWLEFRVTASGPGSSRFVQTARFYPRGVLGVLYWYGILPLHHLVFRGMAHAIVRRAARLQTPDAVLPSS